MRLTLNSDFCVSGCQITHVNGTQFRSNLNRDLEMGLGLLIMLTIKYAYLHILHAGVPATLEIGTHRYSPAYGNRRFPPQ